MVSATYSMKNGKRTSEARLEAPPNLSFVFCLVANCRWDFFLKQRPGRDVFFFDIE
jgi:hypothetical protein